PMLQCGFVRSNFAFAIFFAVPWLDLTVTRMRGRPVPAPARLLSDAATVPAGSAAASGVRAFDWSG
ncbi:MAG: hypothetical protein ACTS10_23070, partial [Kiloniellales bacterium]